MSSSGFTATLRKISIFPFVALIRFYKICLSPYLGNRCRFTPTCSTYALEAFEKHGPFKGLWLTVRRLLRCNPWGGSGYDPVPETFSFFPKQPTIPADTEDNRIK